LVIIEYGCNDTSFKNPGVVFGWGKAVNTRDTTNGFIFIPSKADLNTRIYFTIALESNGYVYDIRAIFFIVKDPKNGIINVVKKYYKNSSRIETYSYNALGRKLSISQMNKFIYQCNKQYHFIRTR